MTSIPQLILRRLLSFVPILLLSTFLVFVLVDLAPGDPAFSFFGTAPDEATRQAFIESRGLDDPLVVRYGRFIGEVAEGDWGLSLTSSTKVADLLKTGLPITLQLTGLSLGFAVVVGTAAGVTSAVRRGRIADNAIRVSSLAVVAAPNFWIGLMMVNLFAVGWGWLPTGGYAPFGEGAGEWAKHMVLPTLALGLPLAGLFTRIIRTSVVEELEKGYVRTAIGSGLSPRVVIGRNVLRNALVSPMTVLGIYFGWLLAGAVLVELVFSLPGLGRLLVTGVLQVDLNVIRAVALITVGLFLLATLVVDVLYIFLNPRLRSASNAS